MFYFFILLQLFKPKFRSH